MEQKFNWIKGRYVGPKEEYDVEVRQLGKFSDVFTDKNGNKYGLRVLDLTINQDTKEDDFFKEWNENVERINNENKEYKHRLDTILASMDTKAIADHQAEINKREYWRKARVDIFIEMHKHYASYEMALLMTDKIVKELYEQDEKLFNDK